MSDTDTYEVISAFLDDESFNSSELAEALSEPAGRDVLIDLVALRHLTQIKGKETSPITGRTPWRASLRAIAAVAAVLVALAGGYLAGGRRSDVAPSAAPPATRIVPAAAAWQDVDLGRVR